MEVIARIMIPPLLFVPFFLESLQDLLNKATVSFHAYLFTVNYFFFQLEYIKNSMADKTNTTKKCNKIPLDVSIHLRYLHPDGGLSLKQLQQRYLQYLKRSVYTHSKQGQERLLR